MVVAWAEVELVEERLVAVIDPVAVRLAVEMFPETSALPWTESLDPGVVEPMPTLPAGAMNKVEVPLTMVPSAR